MRTRRVRQVAVIYDGFRPGAAYPEHEREASESIREDAARIERALRERGYAAFRLPFPRRGGDFYARLLASGAEAIFNLCEGVHGDSRHEMNVCALLELAGIPYTGSPPLALGLARDKALTKKILLSSGIPTPRFFISEGEVPRSLPRGMRYPLFVKPVREDASIGIDRGSLVSHRGELTARCRLIARRYGQPALVEDYIDGRELNVSLLGNDRPMALPVSEIDMQRVPEAAPRICDYRAKWVRKSGEYASTVPVCPARLPGGAERRVRDAALAAYRLMVCRGYARVDIRLGRSGIPYVLEVNPNPCIAPDAGFACSAAAAGLSYPDLISLIIELALRGDAVLRGLSRIG